MAHDEAPAATNAAYISARLDDLGLTPVQFRVYSHICRRAGTNGSFYESVPNCAAFCQIEIKTLRGAMKRLLALGIIQLVDSPSGRVSVYRVTAIEEWTTEPIPVGTPGGELGRVPKPEESPANQPAGSGIAKREATPANRHPTKVIPLSLSPEVNPNKGESRPPVLNLESGPKITAAERISLEKELETIEAKKKQVYNGASHDAMGPIYTDKEKSLRGRLRIREHEIKQMLGRQF